MAVTVTDLRDVVDALKHAPGVRPDADGDFWWTWGDGWVDADRVSDVRTVVIAGRRATIGRVRKD